MCMFFPVHQTTHYYTLFPEGKVNNPLWLVPYIIQAIIDTMDNCTFPIDKYASEDAMCRWEELSNEEQTLGLLCRWMSVIKGARNTNHLRSQKPKNVRWALGSNLACADRYNSYAGDAGIYTMSILNDKRYGGYRVDLQSIRQSSHLTSWGHLCIKNKFRALLTDRRPIKASNVRDIGTSDSP